MDKIQAYESDSDKEINSSVNMEGNSVTQNSAGVEIASAQENDVCEVNIENSHHTSHNVLNEMQISEKNRQLMPLLDEGELATNNSIVSGIAPNTNTFDSNTNDSIIPSAVEENDSKINNLPENTQSLARLNHFQQVYIETVSLPRNEENLFTVPAREIRAFGDSSNTESISTDQPQFEINEHETISDGSVGELNSQEIDLFNMDANEMNFFEFTYDSEIIYSEEEVNKSISSSSSESDSDTSSETSDDFGMHFPNFSDDNFSNSENEEETNKEAPNTSHGFKMVQVVVEPVAVNNINTASAAGSTQTNEISENAMKAEDIQRSIERRRMLLCRKLARIREGRLTRYGEVIMESPEEDST